MDDALVSTRILGDKERASAIEFTRCTLAVVNGKDAGAEHEVVTSSLTIGSSPNCRMVLTDTAVSRAHCELVVENDGYRLRDLDSTNGTFINGIRVVEAWLAPGDIVTIGETEIECRGMDETATIPLSDAEAFGDAVGRSVKMREIFHVLERVAESDVTVLLIGETGTGKEVIARGLHEESPRSAHPFVTVDCGGLAESLIESELFGHAKGAFTGASSDRAGAFEAANGGTIFLDEIGELPMPQQAKILRVLEAREVKRLGENKSRKLDIRIVAATNRPLAEEVEAGTFRKDLYFRLSVMEIRVPALRERPEDILMLCDHFLETMGGGTLKLSAAAERVLTSHRWPGNVRELRNTLERAQALAAGEEIEEAAVVVGSNPPGGDGYAIDPGATFADAQREFERAYLEALLERHAGKIAEAAKTMGIARTSMYRMLKRHGIDY